MKKKKRISDLIGELIQFKERYGDIECFDATWDEVNFTPYAHLLCKMKDGSIEETSGIVIEEDSDFDLLVDIEGRYDDIVSYEIITRLMI